MKTVFVLNGPNLNLLGTREPAVYGAQTLADVEKLCADACARHGLALRFHQSNHEGVLIDWIHEAGHLHAAGELAGVVMNAGAYTHTSVALHDAIKAMPFPVIEVHMSNLATRETWRHHSIISPAVKGTIQGLGRHSYLQALRAIVAIAQDSQAANAAGRK